MKYKRFGETGENIFVIGLGTYGFGDAYGGVTKDEAFQVLTSILNRCPQCANLLIDTAPRYGNGICEKWIGEFLNRFKSNNVLIATKGGRHIDAHRVNEKDFSYNFLKTDLDNSLQRLQGNKIFLYQLHNPSLDIIEQGDIFDFLEEFRNEGKIEFYGVSIDNPEEGIAAIESCRRKGYSGLASIQVIYNILNKSANKTLFEIAQKSGIAIIVREPLLRGFLTNKYDASDDIPPARQKEIDLYGQEQIQLKIETIKRLLLNYGLEKKMPQIAIKFSISHPSISISIPSTNRPEYIEQNFSSDQISLPGKLLSELHDMEDLVSRYKITTPIKNTSMLVENKYQEAI